MSRERVWFARDAYYSGDGRVVELGIQFGPGGPFALEELLAAAKKEDAHGLVTISFEALQRAAFLRDAAEAKAIVYAADALGALNIRHVDHAGRVTVHFPRWRDWQEFTEKQRTAAAERQRKKRARDRGEDPDDPSSGVRDIGRDGHGESVASSRPTETETVTEPHSPDPSPEGEGDSPPTRPKGNRERALRAHDRAVAAWAPHPETVPEAWGDCRSALRAMVEPTQWRIYLEALHPHRELLGGGWALGAPPEYAKWVMDRFGALLAEACSGPVFVVPCATCPTTPSDLANPKEESR